MGTHPPGNLKRNRAALLLHMQESDKVIGWDWLGISGESNFHLPDAEHIKILKPNADNTMDVSRILGIQNDVILEHRFSPQITGSDFNGMCSEVALINGLSHYLFAFPPSKERAHNENAALFLITERLPCKSCSALLAEFLKENQWVDLHLAYMFEPKEGTEKGPIERCVSSVVNELGGQVKTYMVELVSTNDQGSKGIREDTQLEQRWRPQGVESFTCLRDSETTAVGYSLGIVQVLPGPRAIIDPDKMSLERGAGEHSDHISARVSPSLPVKTGRHCSSNRIPPSNKKS